MLGFGIIEGTCGKCGEKTQERSNMWNYGSPIRYCPRCKQEYLDRRWREPSVSGFDPRTLGPGPSLKYFAILLALSLAFGAWILYTTRFKGYYSMLPILFAIGFAAGALFYLCYAVWVVLGFAAKSNAKYMEESRKRMQNPEYIKKLEECGYRVPDEFKISL